MRFFARHWARVAVSSVPLILALGHASGVMRIGVVQSLDNIIYDARLRLEELSKTYAVEILVGQTRVTGGKYIEALPAVHTVPVNASINSKLACW